MKNNKELQKAFKQAMAEYYEKVLSEHIKRAMAYKKLSTTNVKRCKV
jgi:hypothetical protein